MGANPVLGHPRSPSIDPPNWLLALLAEQLDLTRNEILERIGARRGKTTTFVAGSRDNANTAPYVVDRPMNGEIFLSRLEQPLIPALAQGDVVVMDIHPPTRSPARG